MKRITLILSLLLACFGVTMAQQVTDISQLDANKVYTLSTARGGWAITNDLAGFKTTKDANFGTDKAFYSKYWNSLFQFVAVTEGESTSYYLYSPLAKKYVTPGESITSGKLVDNTSDATAIQFAKQADNTFVLKFDDSHRLNVGNQGNTCIDGWSTADDGNKITIEAFATLADLVNVTYDYQLNGATYKAESNYVGVKNTAVEVVTGNRLIVPESVNPTTLTEADAQTVTVICREDLPFEKTTDLNNPKWYAVSLHTNQNFFLWHYVANDALVETPVPALKASDYNVVGDDAYFWCFTGDLLNGFKIYNKKAGTEYTLNSTADNATIGTAVDNNDLWDIVPATIDNSIAFSKRGETSGNRFLNHNGGLKYYSASDQGSSALFYTPTSFPVNFVELQDNSTAPTNAVGYIQNLDGIKGQAQTALDEAKANQLDFEKANAVVQYAKQIVESQIKIVSGNYYRIYSAFTPLYNKSKGLYYNNDNGKFEWATIDNAHVDHIIKIVERTGDDAGKYDLYTCNAKKYMQGVAGASNTSLGSNPIDFVALGGAQFNVQFKNGTMHANGHGNGSGESGDVISYGGGSNSASSWYILPAENIEVALTTVGDASYATAYLPFPVQGDGVTKVYTGTADNDVLNMTEKEGVIPAETGVVLKGTADAEKTTLTIGGEAAAVENSLTGTLTAITSGVENYLVLGVGNATGEIGFYAPSESLTTIAANKAFLNATTGQNAIAMNFDGQTTAINNAVNGAIDATAPVFDLSGRRVMNTLKGGIYIQNGKKFIVK